MPGSENATGDYVLLRIRSQNEHRNELYTGSCKDLRRRLEEHNRGLVFSTKPYRPWHFVFFEGYRNKQDALRRERYLKTSQGIRLMKRMLKEYFYQSK